MVWAMICAMEIAQAQRDVRTTFVGGFAGQLASSIVWFASAIGATWFSLKAGALIAVVGGTFIFPLALVILRLMGRPAGLPKGHPMNALGMQVAFVLPLMLPVVYAAALYRHGWFYPALMVALGAHYLPFMFSYGMKMFGVLAALLIGLGIVLVMYVRAPAAAGAWVTAAVLLVFAFVGRWTVMQEQTKG